MRELRMTLNDAEDAKLDALAKARGKTPEQCVRDFIASCCPGGSGWEHPATPPKEAKKS
jgi:hypothetical protein